MKETRLNSTSKSSREKNLWIQALRGISVLLVMGFHYDKIFPGGLIGVDIFFVISGYVITVTSLHLQSKNNLLFLKAFYLRRILRLTPAFLFFILCCSIINLLIVSPNQGLQQWNAKVGLSALLGVSNFVIPKVTGDYFSVYSQDLLFLHTWSLSIEFQFYAIAPLLFIFLRNSTRKMYFKIIVLFAVILISLSSDLWLPKVKMLSPWFDYYFSTFGRIWEFAIGALLAVIHTRTSKNVRQSSSLRNKLLYIPLFMLFACSFIESHFFLESRIGFLVPTILTAIFIHLSAISSTHLSSNSLFRRVFSFIGDRSYSIYLWHYPIYISIKTVYTEKLSWWVILMAFSLTLMVSDFSYRFFEIYNFSSDRSFRQGLRGLAFAFVCILFFYSSLAFWISKGIAQGWSLPAVQAIQRGCDSSNAPISREYVEKCTWDFGNRFQVVLIGDSLAWSTSKSLIDISEKFEGSILVLSKNGCHATQKSRDASDVCNNWRESLVPFLEGMEYSHLFIANNFQSTFDLLGMKSFLKELHSTSEKVTLILPGPFGDLRSETKSLLRTLDKGSRFAPEPKLMDISLIQKSLEFESDFSFNVVDLRQSFCSSDICTIAEDGKEYFIYGNHLSNVGNQVITSQILEIFEKYILMKRLQK